jgi:hypothetical protein
MTKAGKSLVRAAREALGYARGVRKGHVEHASDRESLFVEELSEAELEAIGRAEVSAQYDHLNRELEDQALGGRQRGDSVCLAWPQLCAHTGESEAI